MNSRETSDVVRYAAQWCSREGSHGNLRALQNIWIASARRSIRNSVPSFAPRQFSASRGYQCLGAIGTLNGSCGCSSFHLVPDHTYSFIARHAAQADEVIESSCSRGALPVHVYMEGLRRPSVKQSLGEQENRTNRPALLKRARWVMHRAACMEDGCSSLRKPFQIAFLDAFKPSRYDRSGRISYRI